MKPRRRRYGTASGSITIGAGDVLEGREGDLTTRIRITYVGERGSDVLVAKHLWTKRADGSLRDGPRAESSWYLGSRDWTHVGGKR